MLSQVSFSLLGEITSIIKMGSSKRQVFADYLMMLGCASATPSCVAALAKSLGAERMIYGTIQNRTATIRMVVAESQLVVEWPIATLPTDMGHLRVVASDTLRSLLSQAP